MTVSVPNAKLRTRRKWLPPLLIAWGTLGLPLAMFGLLATLSVSALWPLVLLVFFAGIFGLDRAMRLWVEHRTGDLRADETGIFLDGGRLASRKQLSHGLIVREGERMLLRLVPRGKAAQPVDVEVADDAQASELLAAMYLDRSVAEYTMSASHRSNLRAAMYGVSGGAVFVLSLIGVLATAMRHPHNHWLSQVLPTLIWSLGMLGICVLLVRSELHVALGLDGIWLRRPLGMKRFVPFAQIASVVRAGRDITLQLTDDTKLEFSHATDREDDAVSLVERVLAGMTAASAEPHHVAETVARNGRSIAEWIASATRAHEQSATYRRPVVPQDHLWRIVEDAAATPTERAGAALALRRALDDEGKARLRVAAGSCAEQKLRVALESVVTADDAALAEALEPLDERSPQRRLKSVRA